MKGVKSYNKWITAGYELFAHEGPEGIQIERLARMLNLNKSGFYYYFGTLDSYFDRLMHHHTQEAAALADKVKTMPNFAPEYIHMLSEYRILVLAHRQLMRCRHVPVFAKTYDQVNHVIERAVLPIWAEFIGITYDYELAARYLAMVRDVFFSRVTPTVFNFEFITDTAIEAKELCTDLRASIKNAGIEKQPA